MAQTLGILSILWNGANVPIEKGGTVKIGGLEAKEVITGTTVDFSNEMMASEVSVTTKLQRGQSLLALFTGTQGELQVNCDTGQSYIWPDAFLKNLPEFTGGDGGKVKLVWAGGQPTELLNG